MYDLIGVNWPAIEDEYRAGGVSNVALAKKYTVTEGAIRKRAKVNGWQKGVPRPAAPELPQLPVVPERQVKLPDMTALEMSEDLARRMLDELDATTAIQEEIEAWVMAETEADRSGSRRAAMLKAVSLPTRALTLKTLVQSLTQAKGAEAPQGKKAAKTEKAQAVARGKFSPSAPPGLHVVKNS